MNLRMFCVCMLAMTLQACTDGNNSSNLPGEVTGYRPVYVSFTEMNDVKRLPPKPLNKSGKIYSRGAYLFISEPNQGVHIINNLDKTNPRPIAFIKIPGSQDVELKGNIMYSDNGLDLIAIDITNPEATKLVKRVADVFPYPTYPPFENTPFECVDQSKGYVIDWELVQLKNPKCSR